MQPSLFDGDPEQERPPPGAERPQSPEEPATDEAGARQTFAVGRLTSRQSETELVRPGASPFPGPWRVKAVVEARSARPAPAPENPDGPPPSVADSPPPQGRLAQAIQRLRGRAVVDALRRLLDAFGK